MALGAFSFLVQITVCLAFMIATAALGDICVRPSWNILTQVRATVRLCDCVAVWLCDWLGDWVTVRLCDCVTV